jgi:hypothetical protein
MAKVFGIHEIELRPGVTEEDFERFFTEVIAQLTQFRGWNFHLAKADRGVRTGKYALIFEIESVEARNRYAPEPGPASEEVQRELTRHAGVLEQWGKLSTGPGSDTVFTDYVVVGE